MRGAGGARMDVNSSVPIQDFAQNNQAITTTRAGGANFNDTWKGGTEVGGSYFYNRAEDHIRQKDAKQYLSPQNSFNQDHAGATDRNNENQRINILADTRLDSLSSVKITSTFTYQRSNNQSSAIDSSRSRADNALLNTSASNTLSHTSGYTWSSNALFRHKFRKRGRTLSANLSFGLNDNSGGGALYSVNHFYKAGTGDTLNQAYEREGNGNNYGAVVSYTEPLSKRSLLEAN